MSQVTIEAIDKVLERLPKATYKQAKEALQKTDGNVVEAIIILTTLLFFIKSTTWSFSSSVFLPNISVVFFFDPFKSL